MNAAQVKSPATELETTLGLPARLLEVLLQAHASTPKTSGGIRLGREAMKAHLVERIRNTQNQLSNVTSSTENVTLEMMNGLDRCALHLGPRPSPPEAA